MTLDPSKERSKYDELIVDDSYRNMAIATFVTNLVHQDKAYPGIVFVRRKDHARKLAKDIGEYLNAEIPALSSDTPKKKRDEYIEKMRARDSSLPVVVATDVWATGIDIPCLAWVLMAGAGQAPIGLLQRGGRATRNGDDKPGYIIYDWQDAGPGYENYEKQSKKRMQHYTNGGFSVKNVRLTANQQEDEDVVLLSRLLNGDIGTPPASLRQSPHHELTPNQAQDTSDRIYGDRRGEWIHSELYGDVKRSWDARWDTFIGAMTLIIFMGVFGFLCSLKATQ